MQSRVNDGNGVPHPTDMRRFVRVSAQPVKKPSLCTFYNAKTLAIMMKICYNK